MEDQRCCRDNPPAHLLAVANQTTASRTWNDRTDLRWRVDSLLVKDDGPRRVGENNSFRASRWISRGLCAVTAVRCNLPARLTATRRDILRDEIHLIQIPLEIVEVQSLYISPSLMQVFLL